MISTRKGHSEFLVADSDTHPPGSTRIFRLRSTMKLHTKSEAADLLGITRHTLNKWIEFLQLNVADAKWRKLTEKDLEKLRQYKKLKRCGRFRMEQAAREQHGAQDESPVTEAGKAGHIKGQTGDPSTEDNH